MGLSPIVSVLITAFNREEYIRDCIESVLLSTYSDFEIILVDDCSIDNTFKISKEYERKDKRIRVFRNSKNLGDYPNRNIAASYAKGKYIKYLDADDLIYEHGLEVMVKYMEKYPSAAFGLAFNIVDDVVPYPQHISSEQIIRSEYLIRSYLGVGPSASIINREVFEKLGGFSGKQFIGDTELWLKLASEYSMVLMNPSLNWWRQHPDQQIKKELRNPDILIERLKLGIEYLNRNKSYFSEKEFAFALKRRKQHFARGILSSLAHNRNFKQFFYLFHNSPISFFDLLSGFKKYL